MATMLGTQAQIRSREVGQDHHRYYSAHQEPFTGDSSARRTVERSPEPAIRTAQDEGQPV
jgi:hypothetical protein